MKDLGQTFNAPDNNYILSVIQAIEKNKKRILVFGDTIYDCYVFGNVPRMSPEAPVPLFVPNNTIWRLGGAANVFNILVKAGGIVDICTVLGSDQEGERIKEEIYKLSNKETDLIFIDSNRRTTKKTRYLMPTGQYLLRIDEEDVFPIHDDMGCSVVNKIKNISDEYDILLVSDYAKGFVTDELVLQVINIFKDQGKIVLTDPKSKNIEKYNGSYLVKPNLNEFMDFIGEKIWKTDLSYLKKKGQLLLEKSNIGCIYLTLGEKGGLLIKNSREAIVVSPHGNKTVDVTGAGDTVIAVIALALSANIELLQAIELASYAAGVCVQKIGTTPFAWKEVEKLIVMEGEKLYE